jgi:hypothetical protein
MSAFNNLIEQVALREKLVKVQLKTDPAFSNLGNISKFQGYIGYILRENRTSSKVFLEQNGAVIIVPNKMIKPVQNKLSKVDTFKLAALKYLKEKRDIKQTDTLTKLIINCNSIEYVESFCIDNGCTQNDIKNIYKLAFSTQINEGLGSAIWGLTKRAVVAGAKVSAGLDPTQTIAQNLGIGNSNNNAGGSGYKIPDQISKFISTVKNNSNHLKDSPDPNIERLMDTEVQRTCDNIEKDHWQKADKKTKASLINAYLYVINSHM